MLDNQRLCCDNLEEMCNTNTGVIDAGIGLFSVFRLEYIHNSYSFLHSAIPQAGLHNISVVLTANDRNV